MFENANFHNNCQMTLLIDFLEKLFRYLFMHYASFDDKASELFSHEWNNEDLKNLCIYKKVRSSINCF